MAAGLRVLVQCRCGWPFTYPVAAPRMELRCPNPDCRLIPLDDGGTAQGVLPEDDPACGELLRAVLNDDSNTPV